MKFHQDDTPTNATKSNKDNEDSTSSSILSFEINTNDKKCQQCYDNFDSPNISWIVSQELKQLLHHEYNNDGNKDKEIIIMKETKKREICDYLKWKVNEIVETSLGVELDLNAIYHTQNEISSKQQHNNNHIIQSTTTERNHLLQHAFNDIQLNSFNYKTICTSAQEIINVMSPNELSTIHQLLSSLDTNNDNNVVLDEDVADDAGRKKLKTNENASKPLAVNGHYSNPSTTFTSFSLFDMMDRQDFSSTERIGVRQLLDTISSPSSPSEKYNLNNLNEFLVQCEQVSDISHFFSLSSETEWEELMSTFLDFLHPRMIHKTDVDNDDVVIRLSHIHTKWFRLFHDQGQEGEYMGQQLQLLKNILTSILQYSTIIMTTKSFSDKSKWQQTYTQDAQILKHLVQDLHRDMILSNMIQWKVGSPFEDELIQIVSMSFRLIDTRDNNIMVHDPKRPCTTPASSIILAAIDPFSEWFSYILKAITISTTTRIIQQNPYLLQHHLDRIDFFLSSSSSAEYDDTVKTIEDTLSSLCQCGDIQEMLVIQSVSILYRLLSTFGCKLLLQLQEMNAEVPSVDPLSLKFSEKEYHKYVDNDNHSIQNIFALVNPIMFLLKESFNPKESNLSIFKLKQQQHVSDLVDMCRQCIELVFVQYAESWEIVEPIFNHFVTTVTNQPTGEVQNCALIQLAVESFFHICKSILSRNPWETVTFQHKSQKNFFLRFETSIYKLLHFFEMILVSGMSSIENHEGIFPTGKQLESISILPCILQNFILRRMRKRKDFLESLRNILVITKGENMIWFSIFSTLLNQFEGLHILDDFGTLSDGINQICFSLYATLSSGQLVESSKSIQLIAHLCMTEEGCLGLLRHASFPHIRVSFFKICSTTKGGAYPRILKYFHDMIQYLLMCPWFPVALRLRDPEATNLVHDLKNNLQNLLGVDCADLSELIHPLLYNLNILTEFYNGFDLELIKIICEFSKTNIGVSSEPTKSSSTDFMTIDSSTRDVSNDDSLCELRDKIIMGSSKRENCKRLLHLCKKESIRPIFAELHMTNLLKYLSVDIDALVTDGKCCEMRMNDSNSHTNFQSSHLIKTILTQCGFSKISSNDIDTDLNNYTKRHTIEYDGSLYQRIDWFSICMLVLIDDFTTATNEIEAYYIEQGNESGFDLKQGYERDQFHRLLISAIMDILETECPEMLSAFHICQTPLPLIIAHWLNHSFVGVLNFREAILLNYIRLIEGYDFAIYYTVALVRYLQDDIFKCASSFDPQNSNSLTNQLLSVFMSPQSLQKYHAEQDFEYVCDLRNKHKSRICSVIKKMS